MYGVFVDSRRHVRSCKKFEFLAQVEQGELPSCFSSQTVRKGSFGGLCLTAPFSEFFLCFLKKIAVQKEPKHSAEMLPSVPLCGEDMCVR